LKRRLFKIPDILSKTLKAASEPTEQFSIAHKDKPRIRMLPLSGSLFITLKLSHFLMLESSFPARTTLLHLGAGVKDSSMPHLLSLGRGLISKMMLRMDHAPITRILR